MQTWIINRMQSKSGMKLRIHSEISTVLSYILDSVSYLFWILTYPIIYVLIHHIIFWLYLYLLNIFYFFKYSCINIFHRRSLCTFYWICNVKPQFIMNIAYHMMYRASMTLRSSGIVHLSVIFQICLNQLTIFRYIKEPANWFHRPRVSVACWEQDLHTSCSQLLFIQCWNAARVRP